MRTDTETIEIESITSPGRTTRVNRAKYEAMRAAFLSVLPTSPPGITGQEAKSRLLLHLPEALFPGGEKVGWWLAAARLDLEAKGLVKREASKPLRFYKTLT